MTTKESKVQNFYLGFEPAFEPVQHEAKPVDVHSHQAVCTTPNFFQETRKITGK